MYTYGPQKRVLGPQKVRKKWVFEEYIQNPPSKKVVRHLNIFVWVFERPLCWRTAWTILFSLMLLLERCVSAVISTCRMQDAWLWIVIVANAVIITMVFYHSIILGFIFTINCQARVLVLVFVLVNSQTTALKPSLKRST